MTHLHVRSWFSFGAGASSPAALAQEASRRGQSVLALTDLNTLAGAIRHAKACKEQGIKPILGVTLTVSGVSLVLLCVDAIGHANLCDLITLAHQHAADDGDRKQPHLSLDELDGKTDGLICLSGDHEGPIVRLIDARRWSQAKHVASTLAQKFPNRFYIELWNHELEPDAQRLQMLIELAESLQLPCVASNAVRHACVSDYKIYDAVVCVGQGISVEQGHWKRPQNGQAYLCSEKRLLNLGIPLSAIQNADAIAQQCDLDLTPEFVTPPHALIPDGIAATVYLKQLCIEGLTRRGMATSKAAKTQLKREVEVVSGLELDEFFLVVREVVEFARSRGIRCAGRGSAANSLIAYLLGITEVDPLRHNLLFERFLHEGRRGMPDIDVDFDSARREEVIAWMSQRWGDAHTAMTANLYTYQLRSAIRDFGKVLGYPLPLLDKATKHLPHSGVRHATEYRADLVPLLGNGVALDVLLGHVQSLHDGNDAMPRHLSLHSGGMVLSRQQLRHVTPIQTSANGVRQIQYDKDDVERLGLIKFDVLGLRMLSVISESLLLLESIGIAPPDIDNIPEDDEKSFELIRSARTVGLFQIESPGQWNLLARSQPENFGDLVAQVALFRPGPLQGGMVHPYIGRRRGWLKTTYPHPSLEPCLRDTYGIILYQEQVLEVAHCFAGMDLSAADEFRRLMSKFRDSGEMEAMRSKFVTRAIEAHQGTQHPVSKALANAVFDIVSKFVGYGFCRSHAAAFARTVYQSAYLKAHYPAAYLAAVLEHEPGYLPLQTIVEEARLLGITVLPPCVLWSNVAYTLETIGDEAAIRVSLTQIENLSQESAAKIVLERGQKPFESLDDLFRRVRLDTNVWDNLARSGALDAFGSRREVLWHVGRLQKLSSKQSSDQLSFDNLDLPRDRILLQVPSLEEEIAWDFQTASITTGPHPMALQRARLNRFKVKTIQVAFEMQVGSSVMVAGAVISRQRPPTAKGMTFLILEDETYRIPTALVPTLYERFEKALREPMLVIEGRIEGTPEEKRGQTAGKYRSILIERIWSIRDVLDVPKVVHGAAGHPGENPRVAVRVA